MSSAPSPNSLPPLSYHHTVANSTLPTHLAQSQRQVSRFALVWPSTPLKKSKKIKQKHFAFRLDSFTSSVALPNSLFAAAFQFVFSCFELLLGDIAVAFIIQPTDPTTKPAHCLSKSHSSACIYSSAFDLCQSMLFNSI